jgi:uncharacterized membrane protein YdcZ (DUF606 family)
MSYSVGGNIQAIDYNFFAGGTTANAVGQINTVLSTGKGNAGYGQTAVANVTAITDNVTAAQWTTLVNAINTVRKHQSGASYSNLSTYTAGANINATADVNGNLSTSYSSRLIVAATSTVTGATFSPVFSVVAQTAAVTFQLTRTATFANADAARYFWNAGGQLKLVFISFTNTGATQRGSDLGNLAVTNIGTKAVKAVDCVARTGTGGTLNTDLITNTGYYARTTANVTLTQVTSTQYTYTADTIVVSAKTNGAQGTNSDNGTVFSFGANLTSAVRTATFNQSINITLNNRVDVVFPAGGFLANTWGAVTIA